MLTLFGMLRLLKICVKLLKLTKQLGDCEGHRKFFTKAAPSRTNTRKIIGKRIKPMRVGLAENSRTRLPRTNP